MPETETQQSEIEFGGVNPILRVQSVANSLNYYVDVLGFKVNWQYPYIASIFRGRCCLFLSEGDQGNPGSWVWIGVSDAQALYEDLRRKRAIIRHPPTNYSWALEMQVEDLDGNVLRMGSESLENKPVGEWLDMYGGRWGYSATGEPFRISEA